MAPVTYPTSIPPIRSGSRGLTNAPIYSNVPGSLSMNGSSEYLRIPHSASLNLTTAMSAFCWIKTTDISTNEVIFGKSDYLATKRSWHMETYLGLFGVTISNDGGVGKFWVSSLGRINDGVWHHVGFTFNAGTLTLYVDGIADTNPTKITDNATASLYSDATIDVTLGAFFGNGSPTLYLTGTYHQPRIFNTALGGSDVTALYNGGISSTLTNLSFASSCKASYRLNAADTPGAVLDESGNANTGVYSGGAEDFVSNAPTAQRALSFGGTNQRVAVAHSASLNLSTALTVLFGFKYTDAAGEQCLISKADYGAAKRSWFVEKDFADPTRLSVFLSDDGGLAKKRYITTAAVNDNGWHTFAFTFNAGTLKLYVDGVEDTTCTKASDAAMTAVYQNTDVGVLLGSIYNSASPALFYAGKLDEPRIFNAALTAGQILALHQAIFAETSTLLLDSAASNVLAFDMSSHTSLTDLSGNSNTGTGANLVSSDVVKGI